MPPKVYITGRGIFSSIGLGIEPTLQSLMESRSGIAPISILETVHREYPVAEVPYTDAELLALNKLGPEENFTRTCLIAIPAVREALESAGIDDVGAYRTGFISATTVGGMDKKEQYYQIAAESPDWLKFIDTQDVAEHTERIADIFGFHDFISTASTACSSGANAIMLGARMIQQGLLDRVVAGGSECLTRFHLNGFNSLMILDKEACKPFDRDRAGISLGEGAGYVVLESEDLLRKSGKKPVCELSGFGNSCEAFHPTASSPDGIGAFLAMKQAIEMAGIQTHEIDYINAHGTGTDSNDISEGTAIERLFKPHIPPVSSTKPITGHTTSAAGSIETIICTLALEHGIIFPNLNWKNKMGDVSFVPVTKLEKKELHHVLSNSFGFGGNNTCVVISKTP